MGAGIDALFSETELPEFTVNLDDVEIVGQVREEFENEKTPGAGRVGGEPGQDADSGDLLARDAFRASKALPAGRRGAEEVPLHACKGFPRCAPRPRN